MTALRAGAGRSQIRLTAAAFPLDGFDAVLDALHARILVIDDGATRLAVASLELTSLPDWGVALCRELVGFETGAADVLVTVTHTFSAPHLPADAPESDTEPPLVLAVRDALREACGAALSSMGPATVRFGRGTCRVNVCRDVRTPDGWWLGADDTGPTDSDLAALSLVRADGRPLAVLATYAMQSSVLDGSRTSGGQRLVSADVFGAASRRVEHTLPGTTVILLPAAAGDQAPVLTAVRRLATPRSDSMVQDAQEGAHLLPELLGERLGDQILRTLSASTAVEEPRLTVRRTAVRVPRQIPPRRREDLHPTHSYHFVAAGHELTPVVVIGLGPVRFVGVQPELNAVSGLELRRRTGDHVMLATMVDGAAKYMADASSYERITYAAMNSRFGRGAAELLLDAIVDFLGQ